MAGLCASYGLLRLRSASHCLCFSHPMSLRALAVMDHTDPRLTEAVKEVAADLGRVRAGSLYRVFSELDSHALRTVQEESLSVAGSRLIEAEKALADSAPPAVPGQVGKASD